MSEKDLMNETMEGSMDMVGVSSRTSTLTKVAVVGAVVLISAGVVYVIRKRRKANKVVEAEIAEVQTKNSNKTEK